MQVESFACAQDAQRLRYFDYTGRTEMNAHRMLSILIVAAGALTAWLGIAITTMGVLVRQRVASARRAGPGLDA